MGLGWLIAGLLAPRIYDKVFSVEQKRRIESAVGLHHGEYGLGGLVMGLAKNNPDLTLFSAGLVIDDWNDRKKWLNGKLAKYLA